MPRKTTDTHAEKHFVARASVAGSSTATIGVSRTGGGLSADRPAAIPKDDLAGQLGQLPPEQRAQMQRIARDAHSPDEALAPIIEVLIHGSEVKRAAVVRAFRENESLKQQWHRAYATLRAM